MSDITLNHDDITQLNRRMEGLSGQLSARERAVLAAVIALASAAIGVPAVAESVRAAGPTVVVAPHHSALSIEDEMRASFTPGVQTDASTGASVKLEG